jgi:opacity protein-like surface antigen
LPTSELRGQSSRSEGDGLKMKHSVSLGTFLVFASAACAQESVSKPSIDVGFNYSLLHATSPAGGRQITGSGGSGYVVCNLNRVVGLVADFGAYRNGTEHGSLDGDTTFTYLFGPRFSWRRWSRITPYTQFLFGGARISGAFANADGVVSTSAQNSFALAAGAGIDIAVAQHIAIKPIQLDYALTQASGFAGNRIGVQNGFRYSAGIVFRFGER